MASLDEFHVFKFDHLILLVLAPLALTASALVSSSMYSAGYSMIGARYVI